MREIPRWKRALADLPLVLLSAGILVLLLRTVASRLDYPYDLEWMEGGMLLHAHRVLDGEGIYVMPELSFIPFIYPPLYPWILGLLGHVFDLGYTLGRAVSFAGVLAAGAAIVAAIRQERGGWGPALGGAALFFACYPDSGGFMDLVRNDGVLMGLVAWALVLVRMERLRLAGLLLVLAFATKHAAAIYGLPAVIWLGRCHGRPTAQRYFVWSVGPALLFTIVMTVLTGGLFLTYILEVPAAHPFVFKRFIKTAPIELANALPWTSAAAIVAAAVMAFERRRPTSGMVYWTTMGLVGILVSMVMRGHHGGYLNVLMPGTWFLALWGGLGAMSLRTRWPVLPVIVATSVLMAGQLWDSRWEVTRYAPTAADRVAGDAIVERLAAIDGPVLAPWSPYLPKQAGKEGSVALIALWDIYHKRSPLTDEARLIRRALKKQRFAAVLTARTKHKKGLEGLGTHYTRAPFTEAPRGSCGRRKNWDKSIFCPKTGHPVKPQQLWIPKEK